MLVRVLMTLSLLSVLSVVAEGGDNFIKRWGGTGGGYLIYQDNRTVVITAPGTYKFEALDLDPNDPNTVLGLGVIDHMLVDANCPSGTINLYVLRDPNEGGGPGTRYVLEFALVDPNEPDVVSNLAETRATETLADVEATAITGPVIADESIGDVTVDYLGGDITTADLGNVTVTAGLTGSPTITVDGDYEGIMIFGSEENPVDLPALAITGNAVSPMGATGDMAHPVTVGGLLAGLTVAGGCPQGVTLTAGSMSGVGTLSIGGVCQGAIVVQGNVGRYHNVSLGGGLGSSGSVTAYGAWNGALHCDGDLDGAVEAASFGQYSSVEVTGDLGGSLIADTTWRGTVTLTDFTGDIESGTDFYANLQLANDLAG
jgi:hypothetical protein